LAGREERKSLKEQALEEGSEEDMLNFPGKFIVLYSCWPHVEKEGTMSAQVGDFCTWLGTTAVRS